MSLSSLRLALWSFDILCHVCKVVPPLNRVARALNVFILSLFGVILLLIRLCVVIPGLSQVILPVPEVVLHLLCFLVVACGHTACHLALPLSLCLFVVLYLFVVTFIFFCISFCPPVVVLCQFVDVLPLCLSLMEEIYVTGPLQSRGT